jgi:hypothetical protein
LFVGTVTAAAALATTLPTASAQAATLIARAYIAPGALTVGGGPATVDPTNPQRLSLPLEVIDARGNGAGWSVFLSARPVAGPSTTIAHVPAPAVTCATNSTCTLPVTTIAYPLSVALTGRAVKVLNAAPTTGMGGMVTTLALDGGVAAGQAVNTTVTVASGP